MFRENEGQIIRTARFRKDLGDLTDLKNSISEIGQLHPIIYDSNGELICGERRLKACQELGIEPKYVKIDFDNPAIAEIHENTIRKNFTAREDYEIQQYYTRLLSRRPGPKTDNSGTNDTGTIDSKKQPRDVVADITGVGTATLSKINTIFGSDNEDIKKKVDDEKISVDAAYKEIKKREKQKKNNEKKKEIEKKAAELPTSSVDNTGNIVIKNGWYKVGNQYLYCGSNLDAEFIERLPYASLVFADPPYNAGVDEWDYNFKWQHDMFIDNGDVYCVTPGGWNAYNFYKDANLPYVWEIICNIKNGMTHGKCGYANYIKISVFSRSNVKISKDLFDITIKTSETEDTGHKGRKPYEFMGYVIDLFTKEGDKIIDIFGGSGTTLLMSEQMNRISYSAEINSDYCKDIILRAFEKGMVYERI